MHEKLWTGIEFKLQYASFHLERMIQSLQPPAKTAMSVVLESSGTLIDNDWQRIFYPHFDAFLPCVRSVPDIINWCFGHDKKGPTTKWFAKLSISERQRRTLFTDEFTDVRKDFDNHFLSKARNISLHRTGQAPVKVAFNGFWGVRYESNPTMRLSSHEVGPSDGSNMGWLGSSFPLRPSWRDFEIGGKNLFEACQGYIADAKDLVTKAENISNKVHSHNALTEPSL